MDIYASDDEKGEDIKRWWRENGRSVIAGSILGLAIIFAGRYWLGYQQTQSEKAANNYQQLTSLVAAGKQDEAAEQNALLIDKFSSSPYAIFSAFEMAGQAIFNDDLSTAKSHLEWIVANASLNGHVEIARLRLAKLFLAEADYEKALSLANESKSDSFASLFAELRGDVFAAQGQFIEARAAYQSAMLTLIEGEPRSVLLNMKIDDMAVVDAS
jgi:predicted negative regulator of RcsB-dependent stress response